MLRLAFRPVLQKLAPTLKRWNTTETPKLTEGEKQIYDKLLAKFNPSRLQVQDVSGGCGAFYAISLTSPAFKGLSTIKQHRLVQTELQEEVAQIHGLQLKTVAE